jgi:thioredoxin type arsenate reductase
VKKPRVLFLCTANSCRSQMAEGWLRHLAGARLEALSAGTHPTRLHPVVVRTMAEVGIDVSRHTADPVEAHLDDPPDLVIAVCSAAAAGCPTLPGRIPLLSWPFEDPAGARGSEFEVLAAFRATRDAIGQRLRDWLAAGCPGLQQRAAVSGSPRDDSVSTR